MSRANHRHTTSGSNLSRRQMLKRLAAAEMFNQLKGRNRSRAERRVPVRQRLLRPDRPPPRFGRQCAPHVLATDGHGHSHGAYTSTIYPGPRNNFVFNASSCWWADGLSAPPGYVRPSVYTTPKGPDPRVQRITTNLLERMRGA